jgi:hypothetical protein
MTFAVLCLSVAVAFPLLGDLSRHNSGAPEKDLPRVPSALPPEADDLEAIAFLLW